jgi:hypothetical protein
MTAFLLGLVSAVSLPLGTINSAFWRPSDRVIAFLMAFSEGGSIIGFSTLLGFLAAIFLKTHE